MKKASEDVVALRRLWEEHVHRPFPDGNSDPRMQEVALYSSWLGSIVEVALTFGRDETAGERILWRVVE